MSRPRRPPPWLEEVRRAYADGLSLEQVTKLVGYPPETIRYHLVAAGVTMRDDRGARAAALASRLREAGVTSADVRTWARLHGLTAPTRGPLPGLLVDRYFQSRTLDRSTP